MDSENDGGWGDLFAKAADLVVGGSETASKAKKNEVDAPSRSSSKKNHRKRKRVASQRQVPDEDFQSMLESRFDPDPTPSILCDGSLLSGRFDSVEACSGWIYSNETTCQGCGRYAVHHRLDFQKLSRDESYSGDIMWPLALFVAIRNIRCGAKMIAVNMSSLEGGTCSHAFSSNHLDMVLKNIQQQRKNIQSFRHDQIGCLKYDEGTILGDKVDELLTSTNTLQSGAKVHVQSSKATTKAKQNSANMFHHAIRVVMACDACYYRLYYTQLLGMLPVWRRESDQDARVTVFLPHPQEYFNAHLGSLDDIRKHSKALWDCYPESDLFPLLTEVPDTKNNADHPLARILHYRFWETVELFFNTGWSRSSDTKMLVTQSIKISGKSMTGLDRHETPAPELLVEWRDSCRDFMCNLFAYATLPPKTVIGLRNLLSRLGIHQVIDHGAGTGYITRLLSATSGEDGGENTIRIEACDKLPPPESDGDTGKHAPNEYHGKTPAFYPITEWKGNDYIARRIKGREKSTALMLCYPPPQSSMAFDIIKTFLQSGGSFFIHIGEFKGLTGNEAFESLLIRKMKCIARLPTYTWGTDASHITLWSRTDGKLDSGSGTTGKLLLPCSTCGNQEAIKRCRLDRTLVYCSDQCFRDGAATRRRQLRMRMIEVEGLQFLNPHHFDTL